MNKNDVYVPYKILADKDLTPTAEMIMIELLNEEAKNGKTHFTNKEIATKLGYSTSSVSNAIRLLKNKGLIDIKLINKNFRTISTDKGLLKETVLARKERIQNERWKAIILFFFNCWC